MAEPGEQDDYQEPFQPAQVKRFQKSRESERSENTTPQLTLPDLEGESFIQPIPIKINNYNREKKLIRDVSNNCDKRRHNYYQSMQS